MRKRIFLCLIAGVAVAAPAAAADLSPEKQALVQKLVAVSGGEQIAGQVSQIILSQVLRDYGLMAEAEIAKRTDLTDVQKQALRMRLGSADSFIQKFEQRFPERVPQEELLTTVFYPLYDRFFTTEEMNAIVAFYESPAGVKAIEVMPNLMQAALEDSAAYIAPRAMEISREILDEEMAEFNQ